jgi:cyclopropane fatty-acyl-phospholipid synthase-like methyltransferase
MPDINRENILDFWQKRGEITDISAARFHSEHTPYDLAAISTLLSPGDALLDLGCGTCAVTNALVDEMDITARAVDVVPTFLDFARKTPRLEVEVADILNYRSGRFYDVITLLGVINSFPLPKEREILYENCRSMLHEAGTFFIKSQFGKSNTVVVNKYSEDLKTDYMAIYPHIEDEIRLLEKHFRVEAIVDPYPATLNPHATTHFHYIYAKAS